MRVLGPPVSGRDPWYENVICGGPHCTNLVKILKTDPDPMVYCSYECEEWFNHYMEWSENEKGVKVNVKPAIRQDWRSFGK